MMIFLRSLRKSDNIQKTLNSKKVQNKEETGILESPKQPKMFSAEA